MRENVLLQRLRDHLRQTGEARDEVTYPPASAVVIAAAEKTMGFALPPLLRRVYAEVSNGFGPTFELFGLEGGYLTGVLGGEHSADAVYATLRDAGLPDDGEVAPWPAGLLPICDLGCAMWSCLDCRSADGPIVTMADEELWTTTFTLSSWLEAWIDRTNVLDALFEAGDARVGVNPLTRQPVSFATRRARGTPWR